MKSNMRICVILAACVLGVYALNISQFGWHYGSILMGACIGTCLVTLFLCRNVVEPWVERGDTGALKASNWFQRDRKAHGEVVFLDTDMLSKEDIERIKQGMTPVFVEYSGHEMRFRKIDIKQSVTQTA